jgi:predicted MFS family arabinose efflux permease
VHVRSPSVLMFIALLPRKRDRVFLLPIIGAQLILGTCLFLLPVLVDALRAHAGLSERAAGLLVSMELAIAALTTICLSVWSPRYSAGSWALKGGFLAIVSTALTLVSPTLPILISGRFLAGIGAGIVGARATSVLSRVINRERVIAIVTIISILVAAFWLAVLPYMIDALGYRAPYVGLLLVYTGGSFLLKRLPRLRSNPRNAHYDSLTPNTFSLVMVVAAVFLTQLGQGAFWSVVGWYGGDSGLSSHAIGVVLAISTLMLLAGAAGAAWAGDRFGRFATLFVLLTANALAVLLVGTVTTRPVYIAANVLQAVTNLSSLIYQLGLSTSVDRSGRTVAVSTALVTLGNGIGPGLSAGFSGIFGAPSIAVLTAGLNGVALTLYWMVMVRQAEEPQIAPSLS